MTTRQQKIDTIYEKIANKDLSFGCCFQGEKSSHVIQNPYWCFVWWDWRIYSDRCDSELHTQIKVEKIIGHPVMIGDVLDYFWNKKWLMTLDRILRFWEEKKKTIENQSDKCIDYIYNLINK